MTRERSCSMRMKSMIKTELFQIFLIKGLPLLVGGPLVGLALWHFFPK